MAALEVRQTTRSPLPLTTIYTPPPSCSSIVTWDGTSLWQYGVNQTGGDCYPPDFRSILYSYYTPGICPDAWTSAGTVSHSSGFDAMCCPRSYFLSKHKTNDYWCASFFSGTLNNVYFTSKVGNDTIPSGVSLTSVNATDGSMTVVADVIQVQWQSSDQEILRLMSAQTASTSAIRPAATTGSRQTAPTPVATETPASSQSSSSGLSTGAKIGIGVAVPLVVLALLGIGLFFLFRRRKSQVGKRGYEAAEKRQRGFHELPQSERNGHEYPKPEYRTPQEVDAPQTNELPGHGPPAVQEMYTAQPSELPGNELPAEIGGRKWQGSSTFKGSAIQESHYKNRDFQDGSPSTPIKKIPR